MGRSPCCSKVGLKRGPWSDKEDALLTNYILEHGEGQWRSLPNKAGLLRCGKSCRLRWMNYLRPGIKRGNISEDEEDLILRLHGLLGNRWSLIAGRLPGRTDNEIKNYWNTHLHKKLNGAAIVLPIPYRDFPKSHGEKMAHSGENDKTVRDQTRVHSPKAIRIPPPEFSSSSDESLASMTTSSSCEYGAEKAAELAPSDYWTPLFEELEEAGGGLVGGVEGDLMGGEYTLPMLDSNTISEDVNLLERVYDEYLQLL